MFLVKKTRTIILFLGALLLLVVPGAAAGTRDGFLLALSDASASNPVLVASCRANYLTIRRASTSPALGKQERLELRGVAEDAALVAGNSNLTARLVPVCLTLQRNREWFVTAAAAAPAATTRRRFSPSRIVWQAYPGQGWQLQVLANFSTLQGWATSGVSRSAVRSYADELLTLGVLRSRGKHSGGGYRAFEYYFRFAGGDPPWVSSMATGSALQALAATSEYLGEPAYAAAGAELLPAFYNRPGFGVRLGLGVSGQARSHYLTYSQNSRDLVGNSFAFSLIGLYDFGVNTGNQSAMSLFTAGDAELQLEMRRYDTGAWSLYALPQARAHASKQYSDLHYHDLFAGFLEQLCARTGAGTTVYCDAGARFRAYEAAPLRVSGLRAKRRGRKLSLRFLADKPGTATVSIWEQGRVVDQRSLSLGGGPVAVTLSGPRRGEQRVKFELRSATGITSEQETLRSL